MPLSAEQVLTHRKLAGLFAVGLHNEPDEPGLGELSQERAEADEVLPNAGKETDTSPSNLVQERRGLPTREVLQFPDWVAQQVRADLRLRSTPLDLVDRGLGRLVPGLLPAGSGDHSSQIDDLEDDLRVDTVAAVQLAKRGAIGEGVSVVPVELDHLLGEVISGYDTRLWIDAWGDVEQCKQQAELVCSGGSSAVEHTEEALYRGQAITRHDGHGVNLMAAGGRSGAAEPVSGGTF